jgi:hypothetical protein
MAEQMLIRLIHHALSMLYRREVRDQPSPVHLVERHAQGASEPMMIV